MQFERKGSEGQLYGEQGFFSVSSEYKNGLHKPFLAYQPITR